MVVVQTQVFRMSWAAFDVTEDVQISKSETRARARGESRWPEPLSGRGARNRPAHPRVWRVATVDWALSPCHLFYEILIQRDEYSSDRNNIFIRRLICLRIRVILARRISAFIPISWPRYVTSLHNNIYITCCSLPSFFISTHRLARGGIPSNPMAEKAPRSSAA